MSKWGNEKGMRFDIEPSYNALNPSAVWEEIAMNRKFIATVYTLAFLFVLIITSNLFALDDASSLQCDGGIVVRGDSEDRVREKCGDPQKILRPDPQEPAVWVYNFGTTEFSNFVSIVNGNVERIQIGDYGK